MDDEVGRRGGRCGLGEERGTEGRFRVRWDEKWFVVEVVLGKGQRRGHDSD